MLFGLSILAGCSSAGSGGGSTSATTPAPTATLRASPATFTAGQGSSTLTFSSTNATKGSIDNGVGPVGVNSHVSVSPAVTTTYTYTCQGPGGTATVQATVTVVAPGPAPTVTISASPAFAFTGQAVTLSWQSANATSVVIDNNVGVVQPASGGSLTLTGTLLPTQTTTYTATATGNGQQTTASVTVPVSGFNSFDGMLPDATNALNSDIDPNGAIGTKQFLEYVNTEFQAFDKTTFAPVQIYGASSSGPQPIGSAWPVNTPCSGTGIRLDTVIDFDRLASRWVIAAKAVRAQGQLQVYDLCIAVSSTDDVTSPSFSWNGYSYSLDTVLPMNSVGDYYFPDWPKLGTWPDAYYITMDLQDLDNSAQEVGVAVCALDRADLLTGTAVKTPQCFTDSVNNNSVLMSNGVYLGHSLLPADVDGGTPPPAGRDEFLVSIQNPANDLTTVTSDIFNLWQFHVDWMTPANSTFALLPQLTVPTYTPGCYLFVAGAPALTNCVTEPASGNSGQTIDSVGDRFMPRLAYRNFSNVTNPYESFLFSHTVKTAAIPQNPNQTGVRWYELRASLSGSSSACQSGTISLSALPAVCQSGTINPDALLFRFLPSIAQDKDGNAAVGYSVSNSLTDPGIDFSYWNLGTVNATATEVNLLSGTGEEITPQTGRGDWGTYSSMTVDPVDDCTFWYVNEYRPTNSVWATRISNFKMPTCQ